LTLRLSDPLRGDRLEFRIADTSFTQESRRRTARPLLSLFAWYAVGGAPREDVPARTEGLARGSSDFSGVTVTEGCPANVHAAVWRV
jgi:hypothetical protein